MTRSTLAQLEATLRDLRKKVAVGFSSETAAVGFSGRGPASGQCAATSLIMRELVGGEFASARVEGQSHWFNRVALGERILDIDLTADQFGESEIRIGTAGELYPETEVRDPCEVTNETLRRAVRLSEQANLPIVHSRLQQWLNDRLASDQCVRSPDP